MKKMLIFILAAFAVSSFANDRVSQVKKPPPLVQPIKETLMNQKVLSLELAKKMADAVLAKARAESLKFVVSIVDAGGNLKYFVRMDGTSYGSIKVSMLKAQTSASFSISTTELAKKNEHLPNQPYKNIPGFVLLGGGLPILTQDGQHLGGIGVSGATPEQDEMCAKAGIEAVKAFL